MLLYLLDTKPPLDLSGVFPSGTIGVAYSYTPTASGGTAPYTFSIFDGALPPGLTLNTSTGAVTGTPTEAAFTPASLFAANEVGAWYDPSDLSSMFQDSAGTTAAALNQPVGRINDKSGRGNHAVQATTASKPVLRQDGGGRYYLETDAADDFLRATFTIAQGWDRISAMTHGSTNGSVGGKHLLGGSTTNAGVLYGVDFANLTLYNGQFGPTVPYALGASAIYTERHAGASTRLAKNAGAYSTADAGADVPGGITIAGEASVAGQARAGMNFYGLVMRQGTLTDTQITQVRTYLADKIGITL